MGLEHTIHFTNKPFEARVWKFNYELKLCTPSVYEDRDHCGICLKYDDKTGDIWGPKLPRDLISAWRGTEMLQHIQTIEPDTLHDVYFAGARNSPPDNEPSIQKIIQTIGKETYDRIFSMAVPDEIIRAILNAQRKLWKLDLYPISEEVEAGTIEWRQEFARAGIENPHDHYHRQMKVCNEMRKKFEKHLHHYAWSHGLTRECMVMITIEVTILILIEKGAEKELRDEVIVALAAVIGNTELEKIGQTKTLLLINGDNVDTLDQELRDAAYWLAQYSETSWFSFLTRWQRTRRAKKLLEQLLVTFAPQCK